MVATDLARFPALRHWTTEDLGALATLIVNAMVQIADAVVEAPPDDAVAEAEIVRTAERQLRMIFVGVAAWRSA